MNTPIEKLNTAPINEMMYLHDIFVDLVVDLETAYGREIARNTLLAVTLGALIDGRKKEPQDVTLAELGEVRSAFRTVAENARRMISEYVK